jgi:hypothetical protein
VGWYDRWWWWGGGGRGRVLIVNGTPRELGSDRRLLTDRGLVVS